MSAEGSEYTNSTMLRGDCQPKMLCGIFPKGRFMVFSLN